MKIDDAYISFLMKVNQNFKSTNVAASKDRFVTLYNEEQIRRVEFVLDNKNNDDIREIQFLLKSETLNTVNATLDNKVNFTLPTDYLDLADAYCYVGNKDCKNIRLSLWEIKSFNSEEVLTDDNNTPSLEYREAPYYIGDNSIQVFTGNFTIDRVQLSYYKEPRPVDISGYQYADGTPSQNIDPEGNDNFVNKVISMCSESFFRNYGDPQQIQINKDRIINNH